MEFPTLGPGTDSPDHQRFWTISAKLCTKSRATIVYIMSIRNQVMAAVQGERTMLDDTALLMRYSRTGDAEAFAQLVQRYARMVYGTCLRITGNSQEAEDVTQECFLELARSSGRVRSSLPGWLHKVARNRALNAVNKTATQKRYETQAAAESADPPEPSWAEIAPLIDEAVEKLPQKLRDPVILHYFQGLTQAEAAVILGIDRSTVARHLEKAVAALRSEFGQGRGCGFRHALAVLLTDHSATAAPAVVIAALGKIAVSGIGSGGAAATVGVLGTVAGKAVLVSTSLVACLIVGQQVYTRSVAGSPPAPLPRPPRRPTCQRLLPEKTRKSLRR